MLKLLLAPSDEDCHIGIVISSGRCEVGADRMYGLELAARRLGIQMTPKPFRRAFSCLRAGPLTDLEVGVSSRHWSGRSSDQQNIELICRTSFRLRVPVSGATRGVQLLSDSSDHVLVVIAVLLALPSLLLVLTVVLVVIVVVVATITSERCR